MKLEAIPGAEVTVCVNHEALQEYNDNDDRRSNNVVGVKYIEAKSDSNFSVSVTADTNHRGSRDEHDVLCCFLHLDGKFVSGTVLRDRGGFDRGKVSAKFVGKYNDGQHTLERFKFADLETSDESAAGIQIEKFRDLGEIKIHTLWARVIQREWTVDDSKFEPVVSGKIPEKCLKGRAVSRMAMLGKPEPIPFRRQLLDIDFKYGMKHFATFFFKYRSRKDLQIEGIVPRDPSPIPLEDRDINELTHEEALERLRHQEGVAQGPEVKIKKEKHDLASVIDDENDDITITAEFGRHKRQRISEESGVEIIDISDDD